MKRIELPRGGGPSDTVSTSEIGFGMAGMAAGSSMRESLARLEAAYDMGVRHFDTAPTYGLGGSEKALGAFLRAGHRDITITTKFAGWRPAAARARLLGTARALAKKTIARIPGMRARLISAAQHYIAAPPPQYTAAALDSSLSESLAAIGVEHINLLLLHEIPSTLVSDAMFGALEKAVRTGRIGAWGVGGGPSAVDTYTDRRPEVIQTGWSVLSDDRPSQAPLSIVYGSISGALPSIEATLTRDSLYGAWSDEVGADLHNRDVLSGLLLRAAVSASGGGIALFTSRSPERARGCLACAAEATDETVARLQSLVARTFHV